MSIAIEKLHLERVVDPRIDFNEPDNRVYSVLEASPSTSFFNIDQQGNPSNTELSWSINPNGAGSIIDDKILVSIRTRLTFSGTSAGAGIPLLQAAGLPTAPGVSGGTQFYDCPRAYPLSRSFVSVQMTLGTDTPSQNLAQYVSGTLHYNNEVDTQDRWHSFTPTMPDQSQSYSDLDGFARDPFRGYGDNPVQCPRGGFVGATIIQNDSTGTNTDVAVVDLYCTEFIQLSPLLFEKGKSGLGFTGVNNLSLKVTLGGKGSGPLSGFASSLWSHKVLPAGPQSTFSNISVVVLESKARYLNFKKPETMKIPPVINYKYNQLQFFPSQFNTPALVGVKTTYPMNTVQLSSVPTRVIIWVAQQDSAFNVNSTDTYFALNKVSIDFAERDNILSSASQETLYSIAAKNGCNLSWRQWTRDVGSVLALDFGTDIDIDSSLNAPGSRGQFNLRMEVDATNIGPATVPTIALNVLVIQDGVMTIEGGNVTRQVGVLKPKDVLDSKTLPPQTYKASGSMYGGAWYDDVWSFVKRFGRPAINAAKAIVPALYPAGAPVVSAIDTAAQSVGIGRRRPAGGKKLTRAQLQRMLM